eukprot:CAMPEP_0183380566 /NCGR_PEP_ID=MMETSP0164_2-20130417/125998_1 /TAXON_ID=221442 /ORGANISM="Coccolithus pelagicus ssp braarudi, Strain PLY182g" /LENGTH=40 /DNA_ID= /DNA_START= /DNA_END= /DNA_ORIENTATION=
MEMARTHSVVAGSERMFKAPLGQLVVTAIEQRRQICPQLV